MNRLAGFSVVALVVSLMGVGCAGKADFAAGKPDSEVSIFKCKGAVMSRLDDHTAGGAGWNEVRMEPGDHDMTFVLNNGPNSGYYAWNVKYTSEAAHLYTASGFGASGLLVGGSHGWLTIKDETTGAEMKVEH